MDGAVLYLKVMSAKKAYAADVDAEAFGNIDIDATKDARRVDGGSTTVQGDAREINIHSAEKAQGCQGTSYCPTADSGPAEDPHRKERVSCTLGCTWRMACSTLAMALDSCWPA